MILDREFQLEIMKKMAEVYPAAYNFWTDLDYRDKENRKHPANTALPSDPISLNLVPT